ncbi:hypothetical protein FC093_20110 [Ilyomonas limi]|uniref:Uncharacterized protein n=1 Tax=Ilyomonas limi TaxID=2575867 RepID=A0A4U3KWJ2_9BACT|nr:hypothetical protein [Ilyomonas limi]TKK65417.1 hypothetical protein FC093_20110 [Ilyomonas limi]
MPSIKQHTCTLGFAQSEASVQRSKTLISAYGDWLNSKAWCYYCTFTTRHKLTLPAARRAMQRLHSLLSQTSSTAPTIFWVAEPFDAKYGCHLHALIEVKDRTVITKTDVKNAWQVVSKGRGKKEYNNTVIQDYVTSKGAHFYLAKYLQRYDADYDIL